ncbi:MAG: anthranilate phosphoribosyltransferase [Phycisphaeraceae bacterium]|nr:anthranilate phosphoribosyltransferase [Phycisphaeraceae bacterium]
MTTDALQPTLAHLVAGGALTREQAVGAFRIILAGEAPEPQIAALLALIQRNGVTVEALVGASAVMREHAAKVPASPDLGPIVDTCGTGGAQKTFNISTCAAVVAASCGDPSVIRVAKHGNRSRTGRGSAEILQSLGVNIDASPETQARCLDEVGICFSFAIRHHPAARHAAAPRAALGFPTIFNLLGPLTNPAGARRQVLGVFDRKYVEPVAGALLALGAERAMVLHSDDGLDELTTTDRTFIAHVEDGAVRTEVFDPAPLGLPRPSIEDLRARDLEEAAALFRSILTGEPGPARDMVALNAAATLVVAGAAPCIAEGLAAAQRAIDEGAAGRTLRALAELSQED